MDAAAKALTGNPPSAPYYMGVKEVGGSFRACSAPSMAECNSKLTTGGDGNCNPNLIPEGTCVDISGDSSGV